MTTTTRFATHPLVRAVALAGAPLLMLGSVTAQAQSNTELEELRERIQVLEGKLEGAVSTAPETRDDSRYLLRDGAPDPVLGPPRVGKIRPKPEPQQRDRK